MYPNFGNQAGFSSPLAILLFRSSAIFFKEEMLTFNSNPINNTNELKYMRSIRINTVPMDP